MTANKKSPGFDFVVKQLEADKDVDYATVRDAAAAAGFTIYPIMYGRAKAKLGLVEVAPRGSRKKARERAKQRKALHGDSFVPVIEPGSGPMESLEAVIDAMKAGDAARQRYRAALLQIREILDDVLQD
ncbi:MAG: hypothetical protein KDB80_06290 [Planctomycetes bacterium]|nr:hypothetical protein [Planctomycetota bacterium]